MLLGKNQKKLVLLTDAAMLFYWIFVFFVYAGIVHVNPEYMYSNYNDPVIIAWNLSFLPIDLAFSVLGLVGILFPLADANKALLNLISLTLMFCAGMMAISFWLIIEDYQLFWWAVNLWLVVLPIAVFFQHIRRSG